MSTENQVELVENATEVEVVVKRSVREMELTQEQVEWIGLEWK